LDQRLDEALLKDLSGGDTQRTRRDDMTLATYPKAFTVAGRSGSYERNGGRKTFSKN
jgi:hypothetical protein